MKKLFFFLALSFFAFNTKAQDLSFEETVKYIKEKLLNTEKPIDFQDANWKKEKRITAIEINKNGKIMFFAVENGKDAKKADSVKINLFELAPVPNGIYSSGSQTKFYTKDYKLYSLLTVSGEEANRITKAFTHLKSVCKEEKDAFD